MGKNVLLLNTPFYRLMGSHYNGLSLGILYIAAVLRDGGHQVAVLNADYENRNDYLDQAGIFKGYGMYREIHATPDHYIWDETVKEILDRDPDYLGITMYTANYKAARIIAGKVKSVNPDIKIVAGGVHPTLATMETLSSKEFDFAVVGEGEYVMLSLVNGESVAGIPDLGYRDRSGNIVINPPGDEVINLDDVPFPARELIISPSSATDFGQLITGRGCPFSCTFCASPAMWKRKTVRFRSVDNVMGELCLITERYPHNVIYFEDDTFAMRKNMAIDLCNRIIGSGMDIEWKCDTRADCVTEDLVALMKNAGCACIKMGVESGSERILKSINKQVTREIIRNASRIIKNQGVSLTVYLMAGFPGETDDDLRETIKFARELDADYFSLSIVAPYFGTQIHDEYIKSGFFLDKEHWEYFYHQSREMIMNDRLSQTVVDEFLSLNDHKTRI